MARDLVRWSLMDALHCSMCLLTTVHMCKLVVNWPTNLCLKLVEIMRIVAVTVSECVCSYMHVFTLA